MQGLKQFKHYSIINVTSSFFRVVLIFTFVLFYKLNIEILLIIEILATLQPMIHQIIVIPFRNYISQIPAWTTLKWVIKFSIPLYINNLVVFVNGRANVFIIAAFLNPLAIANYDVATKIPMALKKIYQSFIIVYFPNLSNLFSSGDKKNAMSLINKSINIFSIIISSSVIISFLFSREITVLLYSDTYLEAAFAFGLLMFNFFLRGISDLIGYIFVPAGRQSVPATVNFYASIISIGSSFVFIPLFGFIGAAYALIIMNLFSIIMFYFYASKYEIKPSLKGLLQPLLVMGIDLGIYFAMGIETILAKILYVILFMILSWVIIDEVKILTGSAYKFISKYKWQKNSV